MKCLKCIDLQIFLGEGFFGKQKERVMAHLDECSDCRRRLERERFRLARFQGRLREMEVQRSSTLMLQDLEQTSGEGKTRQRFLSPVMRIAAGLIFIVALFSLIQHFLPRENGDTVSSNSVSFVVRAFLDNDPAMAITISEGGAGETAPIFWLEKIETRER